MIRDRIALQNDFFYQQEGVSCISRSQPILNLTRFKEKYINIYISK